MHCDKPHKNVIFYGAGPHLAKNLKRLRNEGYVPVCACDIDRARHHRPFCGCDELRVLPLNEALERYPEVPIYVTVDHTALGNVLHYLTAECGIPAERIVNYAPIEYRLGCAELEASIKFRIKRIFVRCYWRRPGIDRGRDPAEDIRRFDEWRNCRRRKTNSWMCCGMYLKP